MGSYIQSFRSHEKPSFRQGKHRIWKIFVCRIPCIGLWREVGVESFTISIGVESQFAKIGSRSQGSKFCFLTSGVGVENFLSMGFSWRLERPKFTKLNR